MNTTTATRQQTEIQTNRQTEKLTKAQVALHIVHLLRTLTRPNIAT